VRVVIGEFQALMREGLALLLERAGFDVAAAVGDAEELVRAGQAAHPDLVVADIRLPPQHADDGLQAALALKKASPGVAVLILSQYVQQRYAEELLENGAGGVGYLLKQRVADVDSFCADARRVADGGTVLDPEVVSVMLTRGRRFDPMGRLTSRQREVLALMAEGRSNTAIAKELSLTGKAVVRHISHIYDELGLALCPDDHRRVLAVVRYLTRLPHPLTARWLAVFGILEVEAAPGIPLRTLVAVHRDATGILQHPGEVQQVPGHERGVPVGEVVFRPA
jgi:DNA-binding NarL/FixJ family response regulator